MGSRYQVEGRESRPPPGTGAEPIERHDAGPVDTAARRPEGPLDRHRGLVDHGLEDVPRPRELHGLIQPQVPQGTFQRPLARDLRSRAEIRLERGSIGCRDPVLCAIDHRPQGSEPIPEHIKRGSANGTGGPGQVFERALDNQVAQEAIHRRRFNLGTRDRKEVAVGWNVGRRGHRPHRAQCSSDGQREPGDESQVEPDPAVASEAHPLDDEAADVHAGLVGGFLPLARVVLGPGLRLDPGVHVECVECVREPGTNRGVLIDDQAASGATGIARKERPEAKGPVGADGRPSLTLVLGQIDELAEDPCHLARALLVIFSVFLRPVVAKHGRQFPALGGAGHLAAHHTRPVEGHPETVGVDEEGPDRLQEGALATVVGTEQQGGARRQVQCLVPETAEPMQGDAFETHPAAPPIQRPRPGYARWHA